MRFAVYVRKQGALRFSETIKSPNEYELRRDGMVELSQHMQNN